MSCWETRSNATWCLTISTNHHPASSFPLCQSPNTVVSQSLTTHVTLSCWESRSNATWCLTEVSQVWALVSAWDSKKLHNMVSHKMKAVEGESLNNLLLSLMSAPMSTLWNYKIFEYISFPTLDDQPDKSSLLCMDVIGYVWNFWECGTFVSIIAITTGENVGSHQVRHMT